MLLHHALTDVDCNAGDSTRCGETFRLLSVHAGRGKPLLAFDSTQVQADGAAVRVWHMPLLEPAAEMCPAKCQCCWRLSQRRPAAVNTHMASANAGSILIIVSHPTILPAAFVSLIRVLCGCRGSRRADPLHCCSAAIPPGEQRHPLRHGHRRLAVALRHVRQQRAAVAGPGRRLRGARRGGGQQIHRHGGLRRPLRCARAVVMPSVS